MATAELRSSLEKFVTFTRSLKGDEKGEAQLFLDHFFRALGHEGVQEAGATLEFRIAKKPGSAQLELTVGTALRAVRGERSEAAGTPKPVPSRGGRLGEPSLPKGGKKFADLLWPDRVLIEMKSRGANLEKHYDQAFEYWTHIVPKRPPYVILCNFDEFWIYDFNTQLFDPVDRVPLSKLAENWRAFAFLLPQQQKPIFDNNRVEVTRKAADRMAQLFRDIVSRGEDRARTQRFVLQLLVAMVAEDIDLLPNHIVTELLEECAERGGNSYDLLGGLFRQMATDKPATGGRYQGVRYFNGGLFQEVDPIELKRPEAYALHDAARHNDWSKVKPEIFGTLFQQSMDTGKTVAGVSDPGHNRVKGRDERHAFGAHFTSEKDIEKVIRPTIVWPWKARIEAAGKSVAKLREALGDLRRFRVLDPACGSGNFLFVAYREMKRLERDILLRLREASSREPLESAVSVHQFYGLDVLPFAVELARVTLMLAKELEVNEANKLTESGQQLIQEKPLPLDNLDKNIVCADALFTDWPKADAIIGNPPYLGAKLLKPEYGADYVNKLRKAYPEIPGMADFCVYWFRKAHDHLASGTRAGLVGTQNIRNNYSRIGGLDYIVQNGGVITDAIAAQVWSGDAQVHVSIVNWEKANVVGRVGVPPAVPGVPPGTPESRGASFAKHASRTHDDSRETRESAGGTPTLPRHLAIQRGDSVDSPWDTFELPHINSALSAGEDVSEAVALKANQEPQRVFRGQEPGSRGFVLTPEERDALVKQDSRSAEVIFPHLVGRDLVTGDGSPMRWIINFGEMDRFQAGAHPAAFTHVKETVLREMEKIAAKGTERLEGESFNEQFKRTRLKTWWLFRRPCIDTIDAISRLKRYIVCSRHGKRPIFEFISPTIHPDSAIQVFAFEDDYSFGVIQSDLHWHWFMAKCSKLKGDFRYTPETVFDTFPWPQSPTREQIAEVAAAAVALRELRREIMGKLKYSLRALYRTLEDPGANPLREAHTRLDTAVRAAYGMPTNADPLAFLLELNLALAAKEKAGEKITPPGLQLSEAERNVFVSADCISVVGP